MTDRDSNFANAFTTTLSADMGGSDLTATVVTTTGAPSSPCYLVIDADDPAKREYVYFDGTFTGTTFVTSTLGNRYQAGSAAASGITHLSGATVTQVPTAQHFIDLHDRIDADATAFTTHAANVDAHHTKFHASTHAAGGTDALSGNSNANARVAVRKAGSLVGTRRGLNFIEGENVELTVSDNSGSERVDVTVRAERVTDHGSLTGTGDDDHTQYLTTVRHRANAHEIRSDTSTGLLTLSTSYQDIPGVGLDVVGDFSLLVTAFFDFEVSTAGVFNCVGSLITDGSAVSGDAIFYGGTIGRLTAGMCWNIATSGTTNIKLAAYKSAALGVGRVNTNTRMVIYGID